METLREVNFVDITVCVPDSFIQNCFSYDQSNFRICQLARICAMLKVSQIFVYRDHTYKHRGEFNSLDFIQTILQYIECPQYLRKQLFPISKTLSLVGKLSPLEATHHLKYRDTFEYREGATLRIPTKGQNQTWVEIGLQSKCLVNAKL